MKTILLVLIALSLFAKPLSADTSAQEKAFVEKFRAALQAHDSATLESFLYIKDPNPQALELFKSTMEKKDDRKVGIVELVDLTPYEVLHVGQSQTSPTGIKTRLPLLPTKKLRIMTFTSGDHRIFPHWRYNYVAEYQGHYVIPVPVTAP